MGNRIWHPATRARGKRTAQEFEGIRYANGTREVERIAIATSANTLIISATRNRRRIFGTSMKKFDFSTSFFVAPHWILYENRCARRA